MTTRNIECLSENLQAIASLNGRAKAPVFLRWRETKESLHVDDINPASLKERQAYLDCLPESVRDEASLLLNQVAESISVERASGMNEKPEGQGQAIAFPEIPPWPEPVDGAVLLDEIIATFKRFIVTTAAQRDALGLFVLHAHAHDAAQVSPILNLTSAEKRSGKTTCATVIGAMVPRKVNSASLTPATIFRVIERHHVTIVADEVDAYLGDRDDLRGLLNSSHFRSSAWVPRCVGDDSEVRLFSTWAPIVLIGLRASKQHDTLRDRSIIIELRRRTPDEPIERCRLHKLDGICDAIRRRAVRWTNDNLEALRTAEPDIPSALNDRAADHWQNLLAIADIAGLEWGKRARNAALILSGDGGTIEDDSPGVLLLSDCQRFFDERSVDRARTADILPWLNQQEDRPWGGWRKGQPLDDRGCARLLKPYGIRSKNIRIGETSPKGYELAAFNDAFRRYLPSQPLHPLHASAATTYDLLLSATDRNDVAANCEANSLQDNDVADVADKQGMDDRSEIFWEPDDAA